MSKYALLNKAPTEWLANAFKEVDWPIPPYLTTAFLNQLAKRVKDAPPDAKLEVMRTTLAHAYTPEYLARMFLERYSTIQHVLDFKRQIDESIRTYFCGYSFTAVTGMVPILEGIIRKMAIRQGRDVGQGTRELVTELEKIVEREEKSQNCYGERVVMLQAFRDFVRDRLLQNTKNYSGFNQFNRHGILHGLFQDFGQDINFFRLITLLDLLCFSIGLVEDGVSMFGPEGSPAASKLAAEYTALGAVHLALKA
jgi:hypothetical protein